MDIDAKDLHKGARKPGKVVAGLGREPELTAQ